MNRAEWLACDDPAVLFSHIRYRVSERKRRLFACALCRAAGQVLRSLDPEAERLIDQWEALAGGRTARQVLSLEYVRRGQGADATACMARMTYALTACSSDTACTRVAEEARHFLSEWSPDAWEGYRRWQVVALRDLCGGLFLASGSAPPPLADRSEARATARAIYRDRAFGDLPILADALEEAGWDHEELLAHCRTGGPHVCGCWALDALLGKW